MASKVLFESLQLKNDAIFSIKICYRCNQVSSYVCWCDNGCGVSSLTCNIRKFFTIQGVLAFHDFTIHDPHKFMIFFMHQFHEFLANSWFWNRKYPVPIWKSLGKFSELFFEIFRKIFRIFFSDFYLTSLLLKIKWET